MAPDRIEMVVESTHDFATTVARLKESIPSLGFSLQFELDIQQRVGEKGFDLPPTYLAGVCNAKFAYQALSDDVRILPNLPCRIAVYERNRKVFLSTLDVKQVAAMYEGDSLAALSKEVDIAISKMLEDAAQ